MENEKTPECLTVSVEHAGKVLGLSRNGAYVAVRKGEIRSVRFGHRIRVPKVELDRLLKGEP